VVCRVVVMRVCIVFGFLCLGQQLCNGQHFARVVTKNIKQVRDDFVWGGLPAWGDRLVGYKWEADGGRGERRGDREKLIQGGRDHETTTERQVLTLLNPLIVRVNRTTSTTMTTKRTTTRQTTTARARTEYTTIPRYAAKATKRTRTKYTPASTITTRSTTTAINTTKDNKDISNDQGHEPFEKIEIKENKRLGSNIKSLKESKKGRGDSLMTMNNIYAFSKLEEWSEQVEEEKKKVDDMENVKEKERKKKNASFHSHKREGYRATASLYDWYARKGNRGETIENKGNNGENERKKKNVKNSENFSKKKSLYSWYQEMRKTGKFSFD
jgi:hypothetical protein